MTSTTGEAAMTVADMFSGFLSNLAIDNAETISLRYGEIAAALNKTFRNTESKSANVLQVGSFGRNTGINGISDLDMLYIMPKSAWSDYADSGQARLLRAVKDAISDRYPKTDVRVDRLVVTVIYQDFHIEVQPVFEQEDGSYKYPDTKNGGSWKITKPRDEMEAIDDLDADKNSNLKRLCRMARAWKNKHGLEMGGLLLDTLAYNFLSDVEAYDDTSFHYCDEMCRDFFLFLSEEEEQIYYAAPGSGQQVKVRKKFQAKAKKAYNLAVAAIEAEGQVGANDKWKKIFGRPFPANQKVIEEAAAAVSNRSWRNTEQFVEDQFPIDVRHTLKIDCEVKQNGFREHFLRDMLARHFPLFANKNLKFTIVKNTVPPPYQIYWKVLNRGETAQRRDCIRGQVVRDGGNEEKIETTNFKGDHVVECYAVRDGVVVAKDRIHVPIQS